MTISHFADRIGAVLCTLVLGMLASGANGAAVPIVMYDASVSGSGDVGTMILDQSGQDNHGMIEDAAVATSTDVPAGMGGMSYDFNGHTGVINTIGTSLLDNASVAAAGGFTFETWIKTDGASSGSTGSVIDYAGTERFQLSGQPSDGSLVDATRMEMRLSNTTYVLPQQEINIADNQWHFLQAQFIVTDASDLTHLRGDLRFTIDDSTLIMPSAGKTDFGDSLNRSIGVGRHPEPFASDHFDGLVYNPTVALGVDLDPTLPAVRVVVDRATGEVALHNAGPALEIAGYSLLSSVGVLDADAWQSNADGDTNWSVFANSPGELGEASLGAQTFGAGESISLGNVWQASPFIDVTAELLLADDTVIRGFVEFVGEGPKFGDLNSDGAVDRADYDILNANMYLEHDGVSDFQAYFAGDLTGDGRTDGPDFVLLKQLAAADATGADLGSSAQVPEPATSLLIMLASAFLMIRSKRIMRTACVLIAGMALLPSAASADLTPLFQYSLPGSTTGPAISDVSGAGNHGTTNGDPITSVNDAPPGFPGGASYDTGTVAEQENWIKTDATQLLTNDIVAAQGGFVMDAWIKTSVPSGGGDNASIIDYSGTERIQFTSGAMTFRTSNARDRVTSDIDVADGQWHRLTAEFIVTDASNLDDLGGMLRFTVDEQFTVSGSGGKTNEGDGLDRVIGVGTHPTIDTPDNSDNYDGLIFNPQVFLGTIDDPLRLTVNTATGTVSLDHVSHPFFTNDGLAIDYYEITSGSGSLDVEGWNSLQAQGFDVGGPAGDGDYNNDGTVSAADYVAWRDGLGGTFDQQDYETWKANFGAAGGDGGATWEEGGGVGATVVGESSFVGSSLFDDDMTVGLGNLFDTAGSQDLQFVYHVEGEEGFRVGAIEYVSGGAGATAAVPEPATCLLLAMAIAGMWRLQRRAAMGVCLAMVTVLAVGTSPALAGRTLDRQYNLGEGDNDDGTPAVGLAVGSTTSTGDSFDEAGTLGNGTLHDLTPFGNLVYEDVSGRPLAAGSQLGIRFDGEGDYLYGDRFGFPGDTVSSTGVSGPLDYSGIVNRGMQFWVAPDKDKLGDGMLQSLVVDTNQHGVLISGDGTWVMRYGGGDFDTGVEVADGWSHVMLVRPFGQTGGARLYVDGAGIGFMGGRYTVGDDTPLVLGSNTGGTIGDFGGGTGEYFKGVIDDLEMFVVGRSTDTLTDYGQFDLATDNEFLADALAGQVLGDLTGDGAVMGDGSGGSDDDVAVFIDNWRASNEVNGGTVGGINTYDWGDFNVDGSVDFHDWAVLRANHADGASLNLGALLQEAQVPEPASWLLATLACMALGSMVQRRANRSAMVVMQNLRQ